MAANIDPIYSRTPDIQWTPVITAANNVYDGIGTVNTVFTADATEGGFVSHIRAKSAGTNSSATVARFFLNNGSANTTPANNVLIGELSLATTTASGSSALQEYALPLNIAIPAGYKINVVLGTAPGAGWAFCAVGGKY